MWNAKSKEKSQHCRIHKFFHPSKWSTCCACIAINKHQPSYAFMCYMYTYCDIFMLTTHSHRWMTLCSHSVYLGVLYPYPYPIQWIYCVNTSVLKTMNHPRRSDARNEWFIEISTMTLLMCIVANEHNHTQFYVTCFNFIYSLLPLLLVFILVSAIDSNECANFFSQQILYE